MERRLSRRRAPDESIHHSLYIFRAFIMYLSITGEAEASQRAGRARDASHRHTPHRPTCVVAILRACPRSILSPRTAIRLIDQREIDHARDLYF